MDNSNFVIAVLLSLGILVAFHFLYEKPHQEWVRQQTLLKKTEAAGPVAPPVPAEPPRARAQILAEGERLSIETPELRGSIRLKGARFDDLDLVNYREKAEAGSPRIDLLSPAGSSTPHQAYYAEFGWLDGGAPVPDAGTVWRTESKKLTPDKPAVLTWDNGQGLTFERTVAVDRDYMFTVTDRVKNGGGGTVTLYPFGLISRHGKPGTEDVYVLHEGPIGVLGGTLKEFKYKDLVKGEKKAEESAGGWLGFTDKYWLVALVPSPDENITATVAFEPAANAAPGQGVFQADFRGTPVSLAPGAVTERTVRFFAGAKRVSLLDEYRERLGIPLFDRAIDFGWYYYLTKPFLYLLDYLGGFFGNMGWAIVAFTIMLKLITLPLSMKSYRSMAKLKALQPEMKALQERFKDDKQRQSLEMMELYKREKVNPMSGCFPMLVQIPIFFALYKILYVGIELRHAPLFGWIRDMSAPDPTSVLTLFGLLDWPFIPHIGVWPVLMGVSMFVQQKLSPQPVDKTQAQVFLYLPLIFTFMMANVAVGLIFYWTLSNILGLGQQWFIMHKAGARKP